MTPTPAVTTFSGHQWGDVYPQMAARGVLTTGGNCLTVGTTGGYTQGGGHGVMGPLFGMGADNMLSVRVVTPDGAIKTVSRCSDPDLFWALRGGGGGTFGIAISVTRRLYPAPKRLITLSIMWPGVDRLAQEFVETYLKLVPSLAPAGWGGYLLSLRDHDSFLVDAIYMGDKSYDAALAVMNPIVEWVREHQGQLSSDARPSSIRVQNQTNFWDWHCPGTTEWSQCPASKHVSNNPSEPIGGGLWAVGRMMQPDAFAPDSVSRYAAHIVDQTAAGVNLELQHNWGGAVDTDFDGGNTSVSNWIRSAVCHNKFSSAWAANASEAEVPALIRKAEAAAAGLRSLSPKSGCYLNECSPAEPDWQSSQWGDRYPRLLEIKRRVDPLGLLRCHHCVGSEEE